MAENLEIARLLDETGDLLELQGENVFRVRAYRMAARIVRELSEQISERLEDPSRPLTELPGIGNDLAQKIATIAKTGELPALNELQRKIPSGLRELLKVPGLGPKRALLLHTKLGIQSKDALVKAARDHRVRELPGFGEKTEENILAGIEQLKATSQRCLLPEAGAYAMAIESHLKRTPGLSEIAVAGSLRRRKDTIGDLDFIVCGDDSEAIMSRLAHYEAVGTVLARGPTKLSVRLKSGMQVDLRVVPSESFGAALVYFTGSKTHNIRLRRRAQEMGLKINEYGVYEGKRRIGGWTEADVYRAVKLPWIPPELREDRGEIELAEKGRLPRLVELGDIKGDLHAHTRATDGRDSIQEMAEAARARGYSYLAITDHSQRVTMARGLDARRARAQWKEIDRLNAREPGIRLLKGIELDILADGSLDLPDDVLEKADWVIASVHYHQKQPKAAMTKRVLRAIQSPHVSAIAHPTGRLLGRRGELDLDFEAILEAAAEHDVALEANGQPTRLDLDEVRLAQAKAAGVKVVLDSDAHSTEQLSFMEYAVAQARRAGLEKTDILNTRTFFHFRKAMEIGSPRRHSAG